MTTQFGKCLGMIHCDRNPPPPPLWKILATPLFPGNQFIAWIYRLALEEWAPRFHQLIKEQVKRRLQKILAITGLEPRSNFLYLNDTKQLRVILLRNNIVILSIIFFSNNNSHNIFHFTGKRKSERLVLKLKSTRFQTSVIFGENKPKLTEFFFVIIVFLFRVEEQSRNEFHSFGFVVGKTYDIYCLSLLRYGKKKICLSVTHCQ